MEIKHTWNTNLGTILYHNQSSSSEVGVFFFSAGASFVSGSCQRKKCDTWARWEPFQKGCRWAGGIIYDKDCGGIMELGLVLHSSKINGHHFEMGLYINTSTKPLQNCRLIVLISSTESFRNESSLRQQVSSRPKSDKASWTLATAKPSEPLEEPWQKASESTDRGQHIDFNFQRNSQGQFVASAVAGGMVSMAHIGFFAGQNP